MAFGSSKRVGVWEAIINERERVLMNERPQKSGAFGLWLSRVRQSICYGREERGAGTLFVAPGAVTLMVHTCDSHWSVSNKGLATAFGSAWGHG